MSTPTVAEMLKYANLQMAAEALYTFKAKTDTGKPLPTPLTPGSLTDNTGHFNNKSLTTDILTDGNMHASRFTPTEAQKFVDQWEVVDHISNTTTGFSGTLFRALKNDPAQGIVAGQLVLSLRSTEFIDDVARDCIATNALEISAYGWAFGQIDDMQQWYAKLKAEGSIPDGARLDVTGYSLGGHLATAFNLLHNNELNGGQVVTFNGAGVGKITQGTLGTVIADFGNLREHPEQIAQRFTNSNLAALYAALSEGLKDGHTPTAADYALINAAAISKANPTGGRTGRFQQREGVSAPGAGQHCPDQGRRRHSGKHHGQQGWEARADSRQPYCPGEF